LWFGGVGRTRLIHLDLARVLGKKEKARRVEKRGKRGPVYSGLIEFCYLLLLLLGVLSRPLSCSVRKRERAKGLPIRSSVDRVVMLRLKLVYSIHCFSLSMSMRDW